MGEIMARDTKKIYNLPGATIRITKCVLENVEKTCEGCGKIINPKQEFPNVNPNTYYEGNVIPIENGRANFNRRSIINICVDCHKNIDIIMKQELITKLLSK